MTNWVGLTAIMLTKSQTDMETDFWCYLTIQLVNSFAEEVPFFFQSLHFDLHLQYLNVHLSVVWSKGLDTDTKNLTNEICQNFIRYSTEQLFKDVIKQCKHTDQQMRQVLVVLGKESDPLVEKVETKRTYMLMSANRWLVTVGIPNHCAVDWPALLIVYSMADAQICDTQEQVG